MERRRFLTGLFGCLAAAALAPTMAHAATTNTPESLPAGAPMPEAVEVSADTKAALDDADKEFSHYYYRRRVYYRPVRRVYYRRPVRRVYYRQPVRRVYYRRPVRRVYYSRPVYYRRPVRVIRFY